MYPLIRHLVSSAPGPAGPRVLLNKMLNRLLEPRASVRCQAALRCTREVEDWEEVAQHLDETLWLESSKYVVDFEPRAQASLQALDIRLGGGGNYGMCYFLTRMLMTRVVVVTDVGDSARIVGEAGRVVPAGNASLLATEILGTLDQLHNGLVIKDVIRQRIENNYSVGSLLVQTEKVL